MNGFDPFGLCTWKEWVLGVCEEMDRVREMLRRQAEEARRRAEEAQRQNRIHDMLKMLEIAMDDEAMSNRDFADGALAKALSDVLTDPKMLDYWECIGKCYGDATINLVTPYEMNLLQEGLSEALPSDEDEIVIGVSSGTFMITGSILESGNRLSRNERWLLYLSQLRKKGLNGKQQTRELAEALEKMRNLKALKSLGKGLKALGAATYAIELRNCLKKCFCELPEGYRNVPDWMNPNTW